MSSAVVFVKCLTPTAREQLLQVQVQKWRREEAFAQRVEGDQIWRSRCGRGVGGAAGSNRLRSAANNWACLVAEPRAASDTPRSGVSRSSGETVRNVAEGSHGCAACRACEMTSRRG